MNLCGTGIKRRPSWENWISNMCVAWSQWGAVSQIENKWNWEQNLKINKPSTFTDFGHVTWLSIIKCVTRPASSQNPSNISNSAMRICRAISSFYLLDFVMFDDICRLNVQPRTQFLRAPPSLRIIFLIILITYQWLLNFIWYNILFQRTDITIFKCDIDDICTKHVVAFKGTHNIYFKLNLQ